MYTVIEVIVNLWSIFGVSSNLGSFTEFQTETTTHEYFQVHDDVSSRVLFGGCTQSLLASGCVCPELRQTGIVLRVTITTTTTTNKACGVVVGGEDRKGWPISPLPTVMYVPRCHSQSLLMETNN